MINLLVQIIIIYVLINVKIKIDLFILITKEFVLIVLNVHQMDILNM